MGNFLLNNLKRFHAYVLLFVFIGRVTFGKASGVQFLCLYLKCPEVSISTVTPVENVVLSLEYSVCLEKRCEAA